MHRSTLPLLAVIDDLTRGSNISNMIQALEASLGMRDRLERELGEDHPVYASCLNNIALFYKLTNEFEEALHWYSQALHKCVVG